MANLATWLALGIPSSFRKTTIVASPLGSMTKVMGFGLVSTIRHEFPSVGQASNPGREQLGVHPVTAAITAPTAHPAWQI